MLTIYRPKVLESHYHVEVPPSKYMANRLLLLAAMAEGESHLLSIPNSADMHAAINGLRSLSAKIKMYITEKDGGKKKFIHLHDLAKQYFSKNTFNAQVHGFAGRPRLVGEQLYTGDNGTFTRLVAPLALLCDESVLLCGSKQMNARPMQPLLDALVQLGGSVSFPKENDNGNRNGNGNGKIGEQSTIDIKKLPALIEGSFLGGECNIAGHLSSQYFSSLLLAGPFSKKGVTIKAKGALVSESYLSLTLDLMRSHGVNVSVSENTDENAIGKTFHVEANANGYKGFTASVPGDPSAATYFLAMGALGMGQMTLKNFPCHSLQGEAQFPKVLEKMGCKVSYNGDSSLTIVRPPRGLRGIDVNMNDMPDAVPTLAIVAAAASGTTVMSGIAHLRFKESNRMEGLVGQLQRAGVQAKVNADSISITGGKLKPALLHSLADHRLAMAFSLLSLVCDEITLENEESVGKTFPHYFEVLNSLGFVCKKVRE